MTYIPTLVTPEEVRKFFSPKLSSDDISDEYLLSLIKVAETEIAYGWNNGSMPEKETWSHTAALLLVVDLLMKNQTISSKYLTPKSVKIRDFSYSLPVSTSSREGHFKTYREIAEDILRQHLSDRLYFKVIWV